MVDMAAKGCAMNCSLCGVFLVPTVVTSHLLGKKHKEVVMAMTTGEAVRFSNITRRLANKPKKALASADKQLSWGAPLAQTAEENSAALLAALSLQPSPSPPSLPLLGLPGPATGGGSPEPGLAEAKRAPRPYAPPGISAPPPGMMKPGGRLPPGLPSALPPGPPPWAAAAEAAFFAELRAMGCLEAVEATMAAGGVVAADLLRLRSLPPTDADAELLLLGFSMAVQRARVRAALRAVL